MRTITKFRRNTRGLSPIFATLILIAIAVIAGIVVYMFTSGMLAGLTGGGSTGQEKMAIQAVSGEVTTDTITVYAQSTGGGPIALDSAIVKDSQGAVLEVIDKDGIAGGTTDDTVDTTLTKLVITTPDLTMTSGSTYTVTLVTVAGGNFPSTSFKATT